MRSVSAVGIHQRAMSVYRDMIRFLGEAGAEEGYKLPTQAHLVRKLKTCHATLQVAMQWLVEDGVLSRRRKTGTFVLEPYPSSPQRAIWRIGIVMPSLASGAFLPLLTHYLHLHLSHQGALARAYFLSPKAAPAAEVLLRRATDFLGLAEDLSEGLLDGIVTATRLRCREVPVSSAGFLYDQSGFGAVYDEEHFLRAAMDYLMESGAKRIYWLMPFDLRETFPKQPDLIAGLAAAMKARGGVLEIAPNPVTADSGKRLARELLRRSPSARPEGLVIQSETHAQMFCNALATTSFRPLIATQTNRQIPTSFALPVHELAVDVEEAAAGAVRVLIEKLRRPTQRGRIIQLKHIPGNPAILTRP
jgi:DNA-binding LacI/PurR family transcriptional regulator